jgi:hypothetical protein
VVRLHRWSDCTGGQTAQMIRLHRWSDCTGGQTAQVVRLHRWPDCTGGQTAQMVWFARVNANIIGLSIVLKGLKVPIDIEIEIHNVYSLMIMMFLCHHSLVCYMPRRYKIKISVHVR